MRWSCPSPLELEQHPQLGALAMLEAALDVAENALATAHPELWLEDERGPLAHRVPPQVKRLLADADRLHEAMSRYRATLQTEPIAPAADGLDFPF